MKKSVIQIDRNRKIQVFDQVFNRSQINQIYRQFSEQNYTRDQRNSKKDHYRTLAVHFDPELFRDYLLYQKVEKIAQQAYPTHKIILDDCYVNQTYYGDMNFPHFDKTDFTVLYYANTQWNRSWGGETLFYSEKSPFSVAINPVPGRLVFFDGDILHCATVPTRICLNARFALALKFRKKK